MAKYKHKSWIYNNESLHIPKDKSIILILISILLLDLFINSIVNPFILPKIAVTIWLFFTIYWIYNLELFKDIKFSFIFISFNSKINCLFFLSLLLSFIFNWISLIENLNSKLVNFSSFNFVFSNDVVSNDVIFVLNELLLLLIEGSLILVITIDENELDNAYSL